MEKKNKGPKAGAAKKWSERLKQIGEQAPPKDLLEKLNEAEAPKKVAKPMNPAKDLDI